MKIYEPSQPRCPTSRLSLYGLHFCAVQVYSAVATGCTSCHEIRTDKEVTRVKLITATTYKLCLTCHADKDATQIKGHVVAASQAAVL